MADALIVVVSFDASIPKTVDALKDRLAAAQRHMDLLTDPLDCLKLLVLARHWYFGFKFPTKVDYDDPDYKQECWGDLCKVEREAISRAEVLLGTVRSPRG
jgi:hypothetical protein